MDGKSVPPLACPALQLSTSSLKEHFSCFSGTIPEYMFIWSSTEHGSNCCIALEWQHTDPSILRRKSVVDGPPTAVAVAPPDATSIFLLNQWATSEWDTGTRLMLEQVISAELFCSSFLPRNSTNVTLQSFSHLRSTQISVYQAQSCISFLWMNSYPKLLVRCNLKKLVIDLPKSSL